VPSLFLAGQNAGSVGGREAGTSTSKVMRRVCESGLHARQCVVTII
jgi:hypothetical protein